MVFDGVVVFVVSYCSVLMWCVRLDRCGLW